MLDRQLATLRLALHVDSRDLARPLLHRLRDRGEDDRRLLLLLAGELERDGDLDRALATLEQVAEDGDAPREMRASALLAQATALRNHSRGADAMRRIDDLRDLTSASPSDKEQEALMWGAAHEAGIARIEGRLRDADWLYAEAEATAQRWGSVDIVIEARTWRSELRCAQGRVREALDDAHAAFEDAAVFSRAFTQPWPTFVLGQAQLFGADVTNAEASLDAALDTFQDRGHDQGIAWCLLTLAACARLRRSYERARTLLDDAEPLVMSERQQLLFARARLQFERAELARAEGRGLEIIDRHVRQYSESTVAASSVQPPAALLKLRAELLIAEARRGRGDDVRDVLEHLSKRLAAVDAHGLSTHAALAARLRHGEKHAHELAAACRTHAPHLDPDVADDDGTGVLPILVV